MSEHFVSGKGQDCNKVNIGGITHLYGNPEIQREKHQRYAQKLVTGVIRRRLELA